MAGFVLAIDQGTTSSRAILFNAELNPVASAQQEFRQIFPASGLVEHDAEEIWQSVVTTMRAALAKGGARPSAIGITNQRETIVIWERDTGRPIHNAIVWQDRRTADACARLRAAGHEPVISARTGLLLDPYFSATKIAWLLDHVPGARARAEAGKLACGTIDTFLIWRLTGGKVHATDATNASRTMLMDIRSGQWDDELLKLFDIPRALLPEIRDCAADFGETETGLFGMSIPVRGVAGDQQAALIGQACFSPGMMKSTYGTGCFALLNTGAEAVPSKNRLLTTIAYQFNGQRSYALEGSIFIAGAAVQWLRDGLGIIEKASETGALAEVADDSQDVVLVPAFVGLGAPYWDAEARGAIYGLTRNSGPREFALAALESVAFQTADLLSAMRADWAGHGTETVLRVDGGMTASDWTMQRLADILGAPVDRPQVLETTALGAAYLAGFASGLLRRRPSLQNHGRWSGVSSQPWRTASARGGSLCGKTRSRELFRLEHVQAKQALVRLKKMRQNQGLDNVPLPQRFIGCHPLHPEIGKIEARIAPLDDEFGDTPPYCGGLLKPMPRKPAGDQRVFVTCHPADDRIVIEQVHVVMPGPGPARPQALEGGDAMGQDRPDDLLEERPIHLEIVALVDRIVVIGRKAADIALALGSPPHAAPVDDQRVMRQLLAAGKAENRALLGIDRHALPQHLHNVPRPRGTGGVDEKAARNLRAVIKPDTRCAASVPLDSDNPALPVRHPQRSRFRAESLHQAIAIEPAFARASERADREIGHIEPGKCACKGVRVEKFDIRAQGALDRIVLGEYRPGLLATEIKISAFNKADIRAFAADGQPFADLAQEADPVERNLDIHALAELLAYRARRERRGRFLIGHVWLDDEHRTGKSGMCSEVARDR